MYKFPDQTALPLTDERLAHQYDLSIAVLGDLGFSQREIETGVPPLEAVQDAFSDSGREWVNGQTAEGYAARLTIAPSVQVIGLEGERYEPGLIPRFDIKQAPVKKGSTIIRKGWRTIGDKYPVHDNGLNEPFSAAILLMPTGELAHSAAGTTTDKMEALQKQHIEQAQLGRHVVSAPISHLVSYEAQVRHAGERGFHHEHASCLVHYPPIYSDKSDTRPTLSRGGRHKQRLELGSRMLFVADEAVLRTLHLPATPDN